MSVYFKEHAARAEWNKDLSFFPNARETGTCFIDANSAFRNGTSTAGALTTLPAGAIAFVGASAAAGGIVGVPVGLSVARDGFKKAKVAAKCRDLEGIAHNGLWSNIGLTYAGLSSLLATEGVMVLKGVTPPPAITPAFAYLGFALYGSILAYSSYGLYQAASFKSDLKSRVKNEGDRGALRWLSEQVSLSPEELKKSEEEQAKILQRKWNRFELRTDSSCGALVREKIPALMKDFNPVQARALIVEVEKSAFKQKVKHISLIVIALLGLAACVFILVAMGPASPLLFAVGAVTWFAVDSSKLYNYIGEKLWNFKKEPVLELAGGEKYHLSTA